MDFLVRDRLRLLRLRFNDPYRFSILFSLYEYDYQKVNGYAGEISNVQYVPDCIGKNRDRCLNCFLLRYTFSYSRYDAIDWGPSLRPQATFCPNNHLYWHVPFS